MAKPKFLSLDGVRALVTYMKEKLATKVDKEPGKSLSDNNYSDADVAKLESIESGAQENLIESISINSVAQAINDKNVNIAIPLVDATLKNAGQSADAKATGDAIAEVNQSLSQTATAIRQEFDDADNQLAEEMTQALEELSGTIPTKTSDLTNDSDYTTKGYVDDEISGVESAIPTKTSELTNDSDYTTKQYVDGELDTLEASIPTKVSQLQNDSSYATTTQLTDGLATKEDTLQYGTATATDVGKAMMPKTVESGKVTSWEFGEAGKVDDVQVNGTSILENKVANIPIAGTDKLGVVLANPIYGISVSGFNGDTYINKADLKLIKEGSNIYRPIVPYNQHESAFYGLAKAAGDATQLSSSNAVGAYTDEAKTAIQSMLGVNEFDFSDRIAKGVDDNGDVVSGAIIEGALSGFNKNKASGINSHAEGSGTIASSFQSHAEGSNTIASGAQSHAEGYGTKAFSDMSHAEGNTSDSFSKTINNIIYTQAGAYGSVSHSEGQNTLAIGNVSHAEGSGTVASGNQSHAEGSGTVASGLTSHAEGAGAKATGNYSHAEGCDTTASGLQSHTEGVNTIASGVYSHAEGCGGTFTINGISYTSEAKGIADHTEGFQTRTAADGIPGNHAEGYQTAATGGTSHAEGSNTTASGVQSHAEGYSTLASGVQSHAEGYSTLASGVQSHAEGSNTTASGTQSHAEGYSTLASGVQSHASGSHTIASGNGSYTEGNYNDLLSPPSIKVTGSKNTLVYTYDEMISPAIEKNKKYFINNKLITITELDTVNKTMTIDKTLNENNNWTNQQVTVIKPVIASGLNSHAEGQYTTASGSNSHAEGYSTTASGNSSHAEGFSTDNFSRTVNNVTYTHAGAYGKYSHSEGYNTLAVGDESHAEGQSTTASGLNSHAEGNGTKTPGNSSHAEGAGTTASGDSSHAEGGGTTASGMQSHAEGAGAKATGNYSHAEGGSTIASGQYSHVEGCGIIASRQYSHAEGSSNNFSFKIINGQTYTKPGAYGQSSHSEGQNTLAIGNNSHAEGGGTTASGDYSHVEGNSTTASGNTSHAEGTGTTASGNTSHAEGTGTTASGSSSHAEGSATTASNYQSHAEGSSTTASGASSHAEGSNTIANHKSQHVFGEFNIADDSSTATADKRGNYVEIVGNGTRSNARSNARTLDWNGNEVLAGKLTVGVNPTNTMDVSTKGYVDTAVSQCMSVADIDATLSTAGKTADAKAVGDEISELKADLSEISEVHGSKTIYEYEYTPVELNLGAGSWTNHGVVFTQNNDGTISAVGTNTHTGGIIFGIRSSSAELAIPLTAGEKYRLTGCPVGGAASGGYSLTIRLASGGGPLARDIGEGVVIDITETTTYKIHITVAQGLTIDKVFTPKLEKMTVVGQETVDVLTAKDDVAREGKVDKQQGVENAGKALIVGSDGIVVPSDAMTGTVRYNTAQTLTDENKFQARENIGANAIYLSNTSGTENVGDDASNVQYYYWGNGGLIESLYSPPNNNIYYAINDLIPVNAGDIVNLYNFGVVSIKKLSTADPYSVAIIGMYDNDGNDSPGRVNLSSEYVIEKSIDMILEPTNDKDGYGEINFISIRIPNGCTQVGLFYKRHVYEYTSPSNPEYEIIHTKTVAVIDQAVTKEIESIASEVYDEKQSSEIDSVASDYYLKGASPKIKADLPLCIIGAGQSNIDGRNTPSELPNGITLPLSGLKYIKNDESGIFSNEYPSGNWSFDLIVCNEIVKNLGVNKLFYIKWSQGGTSIDPSGDGTAHWTADYESLDSIANSLLYKFDTEISQCNKNNPNAYKIGAMIWHQGESDRASYSPTAANNYYTNLKKVIAYCRGVVGNKLLPFICGTVPVASGQYDAKVDAAIRRVAAEDDYVWLVDLSNAVLKDNYHMNAAWSEYFGKKVYDFLIDAKVIQGTKINPSEP